MNFSVGLPLPGERGEEKKKEEEERASEQSQTLCFNPDHSTPPRWKGARAMGGGGGGGGGSERVGGSASSPRRQRRPSSASIIEAALGRPRLYSSPAVVAHPGRFLRLIRGPPGSENDKLRLVDDDGLELEEEHNRCDYYYFGGDGDKSCGARSAPPHTHRRQSSLVRLGEEESDGDEAEQQPSLKLMVESTPESKGPSLSKRLRLLASLCPDVESDEREETVAIKGMGVAATPSRKSVDLDFINRNGEGGEGRGGKKGKEKEEESLEWVSGTVEWRRPKPYVVSLLPLTFVAFLVAILMAPMLLPVQREVSSRSLYLSVSVSLCLSLSLSLPSHLISFFLQPYHTHTHTHTQTNIHRSLPPHGEKRSTYGRIEKERGLQN